MPSDAVLTVFLDNIENYMKRWVKRHAEAFDLDATVEVFGTKTQSNNLRFEVIVDVHGDRSNGAKPSR